MVSHTHHPAGWRAATWATEGDSGQSARAAIEDLRARLEPPPAPPPKHEHVWQPWETIWDTRGAFSDYRRHCRICPLWETTDALAPAGAVSRSDDLGAGRD